MMVGRIRGSGPASKTSSRNEDRDANPMNDALPGEAVRRNHRQDEKSGPSMKALAETDLQTVLAKGSGTREKWLKKALLQVSDGELAAVDVYSILKVPDFASGLKEATGRSMYKSVCSRLALFSKGQQRFLAKECVLAQLFGGQAESQTSGRQDPANGGPTEATEDMLARVRAFVREKQGMELDQVAVGEPDGESVLQQEWVASQPNCEPDGECALQQDLCVPVVPQPFVPVVAQPLADPAPSANQQDTSAVAAIMARAVTVASAGKPDLSKERSKPKDRDAGKNGRKKAKSKRRSRSSSRSSSKSKAKKRRSRSKGKKRKSSSSSSSSRKSRKSRKSPKYSRSRSRDRKKRSS